MRIALLSASLVALAGCGDNYEPETDEPGPVATGRTVTGSHIVSFRELDRTVLSQTPVDLWTTVIEAHVPDGDGWRVVPGTGHRDGSFAIPDVPDGGAWLRAARRPFGDSFYWTTADHVSFDESVLGAEYPRSASEGDKLALALDGLAPWGDTDELAWFVPDDDVFDMNVVWANPPAMDATTLVDAVDWTGRSLADANAGDHAYLVQYRTKQVNDAVVLYAPVRAASIVVHQQPGVTSTLTATMKEPEPLAYHLAWARDAFEAERTAVHPTRAGASYNHGFSVTALPALVDGDLWTGVEYPVARLADPSLLDGTTPLDLGEIAIPNPFPRSWLVDLYVVTFPVDFPLPDGTPMTLEATLGRRSTGLTEDGPARPFVTPVRAPQIAGRDAFRTQTDVGLTPQLSWQPPATGTATSYSLQIIEAVMNPPPPYRSGWYVTAELMVPGDVTTIRVPADVLRAGTTYGVVIRTFAQPGQDVATRPFQARGTAGFADAVLGPFTP